MKKLVIGNSLLLFFTTTYVISWTGICLSFGQIGVRIFQGEDVLAGGYLRLLILIWLSMIAGPFICGIFFTATIDGKQGLKHLLRSIVKWKVHIKWNTVHYTNITLRVDVT